MYYAAVDHGIMHARRITTDRIRQARLYMMDFGMGGGRFPGTPVTPPAGENMWWGGGALADRMLQYALEELLTAPHIDPDLRDHVRIENPLAPVFGNDPIANHARFGHYRYILQENVFTQMLWAITARSTIEESNPTQFDNHPGIQTAVGGTPVDRNRTLTVSNAIAGGTSFTAGSSNWDLITIPTNGNANRAFNEWAVEHYAHDGVNLTIPTVERVNAMLAGTTRDPDDITGYMKLRHGTASVRTIAANAVMAGAQPEHFPVILSSLEIYSYLFEDDMAYHHGQGSGLQTAVMMVVSGPLVDELGLGTGRGGTTYHANRVIGRAFRLGVRNIGHSQTPVIDTSGRFGRQNDHTTIVVAESTSELPAGWEPHHVLKGFDHNQSTVTLHLIQEILFGNHERMGGEPNAWNATNVLQNLRNSLAAVPQVLVLPPAMAHEFADMGMDSKFAFHEHIRQLPLQSSDMPGNFFRIGNPAASGAAMANQRVTWTVVSGGDPGVPTIHQAHGIHGLRGFNTMLIGGARLSQTRAATDPTGPSAPQGFRVIEHDDGRYTLAWNAPASSGGPGTQIVGYQVTFINGLTAQVNLNVNTPTIYHGPGAVTASGVVIPTPAQQTHNHNQIINVMPAAAQAHATALGLPETYAFTFEYGTMHPGMRAFFRVRAQNGRLEGAGGNGFERLAVAAGFNVPQVPGSVRNFVNLWGAGATSPQNQFNLIASGRGAWAQAIIIDLPGYTHGLSRFADWQASQSAPLQADLVVCECYQCLSGEYGECICEDCTYCADCAHCGNQLPVHVCQCTGCADETGNCECVDCTYCLACVFCLDSEDSYTENGYAENANGGSDTENGDADSDCCAASTENGNGEAYAENGNGEAYDENAVNEE